MHRDLIALLRCPACERSSLVLHAFHEHGPVCPEGVLVCEDCGRWFGISDHVLDLLPDALADIQCRCSFWQHHRERLVALELAEPSAGPAAAEAGLEVQAAQRRYFEGLADRSDQFSYEEFMGTAFWRAEDSRLYERWLPQIERGSLVLDVGCGDGRTTFQLTGELRVLAFDLSTRQVRRAVDRARAAGLLHRFTFFVADANSFPVADGVVDCVLMDGVLHHLPEPARALRETARVLTGGGRYFGKENNATPLRPLFDWLQRLRPLWFEEAGPEQLISPAALRSWAAEAGLSIEVEPEVFLPPHAFGRMGEARARRVLDATDRLGRRTPLVRGWGGLLAIEGRKQPAAMGAHTVSGA